MAEWKGPLRKAAVAGSWYPGTAAAVAAEVEGYLGAARVANTPGRLVGLISPHAGLRYSGPVAAHGYSLLAGRSGLTAVLVGPSHRYRFDGVALWARGAFETPLGVAPIDEDLAEALLKADGRAADEPRPHREEHSLEMQLPFLQHVVSDLRIVPALMGTQSRSEVDRFAAALAVAVGGRSDVVLVASSDLSHYHPALVANRLDGVVVADVERFDAEGLMQRLEASHEHACGGGPMVCVMRAARMLGADASTVLKYSDSGDAGEQDKSRVVGYLSAALHEDA
jgi:AmmeMemoRadiSam system protein B